VPELLESLQMGCVSYASQFFPDGKISKRRFKDAVIAAECELQAISRAYQDAGWSHAMGCSGTIQAIAQVIAENGWGEQITRSGLDKLRDLILTFAHVDELAAVNGLKPERYSIFPSGLAILYAVFDVLGLASMSVSDCALREGLIFELLGGEQPNIRRQTVQGLMRSFCVDVAQAKRVKETALFLLEQVAPAWELEIEPVQEWLTWASELHELGLNIAHNHFHKHGAYIVANADMFGFSRREQLLLAALLRNHRRKIQASAWEGDPRWWQSRILPMVCILRLAVLFQRSRQAADLPPVKCQATASALTLYVAAEWLTLHPLTQVDLEQEQHYWAGANMTLTVVADSEGASLADMA